MRQRHSRTPPGLFACLGGPTLVRGGRIAEQLEFVTTQCSVLGCRFAPGMRDIKERKL